MDDSACVVRVERPGGTVTVQFTPMLAEVVPGFRGFGEAMLAAEGVRWPGEGFMCREGEPTPCGAEAAVMVFPEWFREKAEKHLGLCRKRPFYMFFAGMPVDSFSMPMDVSRVTAHYLGYYLPQGAGTQERLFGALFDRHVWKWRILIVIPVLSLQMMAKALLPGNLGRISRWRLRELYRGMLQKERRLAEVERVPESLGKKLETPLRKGNNLDCGGDDQ